MSWSPLGASALSFHCANCGLNTCPYMRLALSARPCRSQHGANLPHVSANHGVPLTAHGFGLPSSASHVVSRCVYPPAMRCGLCGKTNHQTHQHRCTYCSGNHLGHTCIHRQVSGSVGRSSGPSHGGSGSSLGAIAGIQRHVPTSPAPPGSFFVVCGSCHIRYSSSHSIVPGNASGPCSHCGIQGQFLMAPM